MSIAPRSRNLGQYLGPFLCKLSLHCLCHCDPYLPTPWCLPDAFSARMLALHSLEPESWLPNVVEIYGCHLLKKFNRRVPYSRCMCVRLCVHAWCVCVCVSTLTTYTPEGREAPLTTVKDKPEGRMETPEGPMLPCSSRDGCSR
jgi:hypothetical protein